VIAIHGISKFVSQAGRTSWLETDNGRSEEHCGGVVVEKRDRFKVEGMSVEPSGSPDVSACC
jgi:hypothetical protein